MYNSDFEMLQEHAQVSESIKCPDVKTSDDKHNDLKEFCCECGDEIRCLFPVSTLEIDCASANKGESAVFCSECYIQYENMISEVDE